MSDQLKFLKSRYNLCQGEGGPKKMLTWQIQYNTKETTLKINKYIKAIIKREDGQKKRRMRLKKGSKAKVES